VTADTLERPARVLVVYYSATGHVHALAKAVAEGAGQVGAEVRLRHVEELAPEMLISQNQAWGRHRSEVSDDRPPRLSISSGPTGSRSGRRRGSATWQRS
jgi:multimeric flavodoxin WrbA